MKVIIVISQLILSSAGKQNQKGNNMRVHSTVPFQNKWTHIFLTSKQMVLKEFGKEYMSSYLDQ